MPDLILQNVTIDDATIYSGVGGGLGITASGVLAANRSYCFSSSNKGVSWTAHGLGSWSGVGTF